jgi:uncharacterized membrane protein
VSLEGTLAGAGAAGLVAVAAALLGVHGGEWIPAVVTAAAIGATVESILGAWLARRDRADHSALNVLNTAVGAAVCYGLGSLRGVGG